MQPDDILAAMLVWGEARGESAEGKAAVISVAVNRTKIGWPLRNVILAPWQFSSFNMDDPNREKLLMPVTHSSAAIWTECYDIADSVLRGSTPDPTNGANHYCTVSLWNNPTPPGHKVQWYHEIEIVSERTVETARVGRHVFARAA